MADVKIKKNKASSQEDVGKYLTQASLAEEPEEIVDHLSQDQAYLYTSDTFRKEARFDEF